MWENIKLGGKKTKEVEIITNQQFIINPHIVNQRGNIVWKQYKLINKNIIKVMSVNKVNIDYQ